MLIPTRNKDSAMNRLMQRFLWMVLRSLWSPRKKQKVKMQISRHTRDSRMPTHVMTSRSTSCMLSVFCKKSENEVERLKKKDTHLLACTRVFHVTLFCRNRTWIKSLKNETHWQTPPLPLYSRHPWLMWASLCVAERSGPRRYAALHRCAGSIHQCPAGWQAEQCST